MSTVVLALGLAGCATQPPTGGEQSRDEIDVFLRDKPARLQPLYGKLYRDGEWNATLNFNQLGLAAMQSREFDVARKSFDQAILRIEQIYANDANAKAALSKFNEEKIKDFKGEPYERVMTYFYRGILFAREGDYQNARAAFLAADLQGTLAERETYASDFGLMKYLAAWASACDGEGDRARALVDDAIKADPRVGSLPAVPGTALLLVDSGIGPRKVAAGEHNSLLTFEPGGTEDKDLVVKGPHGSLEVKEFATGSNLYLQASTRGGRPIDAVLDGKARFKTDANQAGDVAVGVGLAMMANNHNNLNVGYAGAIIGLVGLVAKGVAAATTPAADTRAWSSLPASVMLFTANLNPGYPITLVSEAGAEGELPVQGTTGRCWLGWGRTRSAVDAADLSNRKVETSGRETKNTQFRSWLATEFRYVPTVWTPPPPPPVQAEPATRPAETAGQTSSQAERSTRTDEMAGRASSAASTAKSSTPAKPASQPKVKPQPTPKPPLANAAVVTAGTVKNVTSKAGNTAKAVPAEAAKGAAASKSGSPTSAPASSTSKAATGSASQAKTDAGLESK